MSTRTLDIEFVSDVACPWCAVGLASLETAIARLAGEVDVRMTFEPFELNPQMGPEGQDVGEHLAQKYGSNEQQQAAAREGIRQRGAEVGFTFNPQGRGRVWNTFDAHRLLYWAGERGGRFQRDLKMATLRAYHGEGRNPGDHETLAALAASVGLDADEARAVLESKKYTKEVRDREHHFHQLGIHAVPSVIVNGQHLIQGGQPPEVFEQALRQLAAEPERPEFS